MSIKDRILKRRERFAYERAHWVDADPEESWFYLMTNIQQQQPVFAGIDRTGNFLHLILLFYRDYAQYCAVLSDH